MGALLRLDTIRYQRPLVYAYDDRGDFSPRSWFIRARKAETFFGVKLRKIARNIGDIVSAFDPQDPQGIAAVQVMLNKYSQTLTPWANAVTNRMHAEVAARDREAWKKVATQMGTAIHKEIESAPTGEVMWRLLNEQVHLITSLPLEASQRVHELTVKGLEEGTRSDVIAREIMRTGEVSKSRATLISRTEVSRTATALTQARAQH